MYNLTFKIFSLEIKRTFFGFIEIGSGDRSENGLRSYVIIKYLAVAKLKKKLKIPKNIDEI